MLTAPVPSPIVNLLNFNGDKDGKWKSSLPEISFLKWTEKAKYSKHGKLIALKTISPSIVKYYELIFFDI